MFKHKRVFLAKGFAGFCLLGGSCMHFPNQSALPAKKGSLSYSFNEKPYVHPKMVWELMPWISDTDKQMLSLSVSGWEGSNRYYEAIVKKKFNDGHEFVYYTCRMGEHLRFGYVYHGKSDSGIHVLETIENTSGSATFVSLFLCRLTIESKYEIEDGKLGIEEAREVLHLIKTIPLGDRWTGDITVNGNQLKVGPDRGRFGGPSNEGLEILLSF
jgi:hypothetical protein